jgi:hypothetical protein
MADGRAKGRPRSPLGMIIAAIAEASDCVDCHGKRGLRAMGPITVLNRCERFRGFVYQHATSAPTRRAIEVAVGPGKGSAAVCSRCHFLGPGYDSFERIDPAYAPESGPDTIQLILPCQGEVRLRHSCMALSRRHCRCTSNSLPGSSRPYSPLRGLPANAVGKTHPARVDATARTPAKQLPKIRGTQLQTA